MALAKRFICDHCQHEITAWDEGSPYYLDATGTKHYAYHPDPDRDRCIGIDSPHLCLTCGHKFAIDSRAPITTCPQCGSKQFTNTFQLDNQPCPYCQTGHFHRDPDYFIMS